MQDGSQDLAKARQRRPSMRGAEESDAADFVQKLREVISLACPYEGLVVHNLPSFSQVFRGNQGKVMEMAKRIVPV